jgi:hypothetical protein
MLFVGLLYGVKSLLGFFKPVKGGGLPATNLKGGDFQSFINR